MSVKITVVQPYELPEELLIQLGRFSSNWARLEQEVLLHTSALCAQSTDGEPIEWLRLGFKKLRERWFKEARRAFPSEVVTIKQLNDRLHRRSMARNYALHAVWYQTGPDTFRAEWFEQKQYLTLEHMKDITIDGLHEQNNFLAVLHDDFVRFSRRKN